MKIQRGRVTSQRGLNSKQERGDWGDELHPLGSNIIYLRDGEKGNESVLLDTVPIDHNYLLHSPTSQSLVKESTTRCQNDSEHMYFYQTLSLKSLLDSMRTLLSALVTFRLSDV